MIAWNWLNLVVFDLANQRFPDAVKEDALNKPWRPIPAGYITPKQMRQVLLASIPVVFGINRFFLGAWQATSLLFGLTWMYNDLKGGEEDWLLRKVIIGSAFALYNCGSLRVASGADYSLHSGGIRWVAIIADVIFSTMHIQDLKDIAGDRARDRKSAPLVLGDGTARWTITVPLLAWSLICPLYLGVGLPIIILPVALGTYIALRTLWMRGPREDRKSWYLWAAWLVCLYVLPLAKGYPTLRTDLFNLWDNDYIRGLGSHIMLHSP